MVDMTALTQLHSGAEADARSRKRRRAEARLKAYGIIAIAIAGFALVALLSSVLGKAAGALTETYIALPVTLEAEEIDPDGTGDPKIIRRGSFDKLLKASLKTRFPEAKGRKVKRALNDLTSAGAVFELAEKVAGEPELVGQTIEYRFLASDVSDLYFKGAYGELLDQEVGGTLSVELEKKTAILQSSNDDFAEALAQVKSDLRTQIAGLERQIAREKNGVEHYRRELAKVQDDEEKASHIKQIEAREAKVAQFQKQIDAIMERARARDAKEELDTSNRSVLIHAAGGWFRATALEPSRVEADILIAPKSSVDGPLGDWDLFVTELPQESRKVTDHQIVWLEELKADDRIETVFNARLFTTSDSREPELAGIRGALVGSFWTMLVTFALAFPIGVFAAIYLEEFAPKNKLTEFVEVNINNLAAVPSIVFGLLGLSVFLGFFGVPRSAPLAGGIVLALMTLPTIIIASRAAVRAVPPSIRDAAIGLGASRLQASFHHVLPLAMPGILTGTIIGMAQALGETAPLIMIGMVAFIVDVPGGIMEPATILPVQVFRWSDFPERAFEARTAVAICVLLLFLIVMNALAVFLRKRFEKRW